MLSGGICAPSGGMKKPRQSLGIRRAYRRFLQNFSAGLKKVLRFRRTVRPTGRKGERLLEFSRPDILRPPALFHAATDIEAGRDGAVFQGDGEGRFTTVGLWMRAERKGGFVPSLS